MAELRALRALCDSAMPEKLRQNLLASLDGHRFLDPESQVIFESIRASAKNGPISRERLALHLNNRGFPDVDVDLYFPETHTNSEASVSTNKKQT